MYTLTGIVIDGRGTETDVNEESPEKIEVLEKLWWYTDTYPQWDLCITAIRGDHSYTLFSRSP
jgi:hypothetical protein